MSRGVSTVTAQFSTDGRVSGFSGCNQYSGTYTTSGGLDLRVEVARRHADGLPGAADGARARVPEGAHDRAPLLDRGLEA